MIEVEASIRKLLLTAPAVTTIVADRVTLGSAEQNERRPRIVLTLLSKEHSHRLDGPDEWVTGTLQVACLAPDYRGAHELADAVTLRLNGYAGEGVNAQTILNYVEVDSSEDIEAITPAGQPRPTWGVAVTVRFMAHQEN